MGYIQFDKTQLINLEYSLNREILKTNRSGAYACSTIISCNTRKYHGLLVTPLKQFGWEKYVLLSTLDVSVIQHDQIFNLGIHKYDGDHYDPKGHKYIRDFEIDLVAKTVYRVGGVVLEQDSLLVENKPQILIRYTLVEAHSPTILRFKPFLAFRNMHELTHSNMDASFRAHKVSNGVRVRMYPGFPYLHMQFNKTPDYVHVPHWYYNIEYLEEQRRGYDFREDLYVPGYFELPIKKGESIVFSASVTEESPLVLKRKFTAELKKREPRDSLRACLVNAARQFIQRLEDDTEVVAGYPWFGSWGRDTFIALPGLTLAYGDADTCREVLATMKKRMKGGLFPNMGGSGKYVYNSVDAPLWFFRSLQEYLKYTGLREELWEEYGPSMKAVLKAYRQGTDFGIRMDANGLIYSGVPGKALTWMDAVVNGVPVTPRNGYAVEINALWYNAIQFTLGLAEEFGDKAFVKEWKELPPLIRESFLDTFWNQERGFLADYVNEDIADWSVRPNMVIATALDHVMLDDLMIRSVLEVIEKELLTPKGLRTLSPRNKLYRGVYQGTQEERDRAYHQGTVWPWLLEFFCLGYLKVNPRSAYGMFRKILNGMEEEMTIHGVGTLSEIYDGDPPHRPRGAISQAWSVAAVLQMINLLQETEEVSS
ncbi:MAG TPA: amylo-alpha-1,6-glucosidase [Bacteroidetes bacterium]|nr:amylo-alpha-1,6-glucosidase [Bacteroidota bacterium]